MGLNGIMRPQSVALVGASEKKGFGYWTAYNLLQSKDHLRLYFIHPTREQVLGQPCYRTISDLPEVVDCVILATRRDTVPALLEEAGKKGIHSAMVYASGFAEEHTEAGRALEEQLKDVAARYGMDVLGPNCMGIINNVDKINTLGLETAGDCFQRKPYVGVVAQSGALANIFMKRAGYPVGYQITAGNSAVLAVEDFLEYLVEDDAIRVIAMYLEGIKKPEVFYRALKKAALARKPIVALKVGRSALGATSASSHTGNLAGSHRAFEAVFQKYGVLSVDTMEQLLSLSQALAAIHGNLPRSSGLASCNLSGGANILSADCAERYGLELPKLQPETLSELARYIPSYATPANPLDATTDLFGQTERIVGVLKALDSDPNVGAVTITQDIAAQATEIVRGMVEAVVEGRRRGVRKPVFFNCITEMDRSLEIRALLEENGVGLLPSMPEAYRCLRALMDFAAYDPAAHELETLPAPALGKGCAALSESGSKQALRACGVPVPGERLAVTEDDLAGIDIPFPWAMKIQSPDILHKTDLGCVRLGVTGLEQACTAFREILVNAERGMPEARVEGVVVQEMAKPGLEFIVGVSNDPQLGPMVLAGMGGVFTELFQDAAMLPAPVNRDEALSMLHALKAWKLLQGYRGAPAADVEALADAIVKISRYARDNRDRLREMDVNPIFVYPVGEGVCAADALVVRAVPAEQPNNDFPAEKRVCP